jgi:glucose/arabinose dehydrogenase
LTRSKPGEYNDPLELRERQPMRSVCLCVVLGVVTEALALPIVAQTSAADRAQRPAATRDDLFYSEPKLEAGPWTFATAQARVRVSVVARGLVHPWSIAFLPNGDALVTERPGRLRLVRAGKLDPSPVAGVPMVYAKGQGGLFDVALHPNFATNGFVYLAYAKPGDGPIANTTAIARGRFDGTALVEVADIFVADAWRTGGALTDGGHGGRLAFDRTGHLHLAVGDRNLKGAENRAQDLGSHMGKVLRLNDDGSVPRDNPFVGTPGARPEVFTLGHRNPQGLAVHPDTGAVWLDEHGPQGGDELNVLTPGGNYGWPLVSFGLDYDGHAMAQVPWAADKASPLVFFSPAIAPSGLAFYTGSAFPAWRGSVFMGAMGRVAAGHLNRQAFTATGPIGGEVLLGELKQRIRDVRQGPDGLLYLLTEAEDGALLKIEPAGVAP